MKTKKAKKMKAKTVKKANRDIRTRIRGRKPQVLGPECGNHDKGENRTR